MRIGAQVFAIFLLLPSVGHAAEYHVDENVAPKSAEDVFSPMRDSIRERPAPIRGVLGKRLENAPPFWRDATGRLRFRLYELERRDGDSMVAEAIAGGTEWELTTGSWNDRLSLSASWYTSFEIDAPEAGDGTSLLGPGQSDLSVIGKAYAEIDFGKFIARLYRQDFDLPFLNRQDSRMIPNTHEGYVVGRTGPKVSFSTGYITKMKGRDDENFVPMAKVAGVDDDDGGTQVAGLKYGFTDTIDLGGILLRTPDVFQTAYAEGSWRRSLSERWSAQLGIQYTDQRSIGDEKLGDFQTRSFGVRSTLSYRGTVASAVYTSTDEGAGIRKPYGGSPSFNSLMLFDFDRAGEKAWGMRLSQDFERFGLPGFGLQVNYTRGRHGRNADGDSLRDEREIDFTADFRPSEGRFKGFWLRLRYARGDRGASADDRRDVRLILNYEISL